MNCGDDSKAFKDSTFIPASASTQDSEPSNKAKKDKKKKYWRDKKNSREPKGSTISASGVNAAEVGGKRKKRNKKDMSKITYFNCNKKDAILISVRSRQKTSISLGNLHIGD